jgi:hypothetical protein
MNCPDDGARMKCRNTTRMTDGGVTRGYKCPTCGKNFVTAEYIRDKVRAVPGKKLAVTGAAFARVTGAMVDELVIEKLEALIQEVKSRAA